MDAESRYGQSSRSPRSSRAAERFLDDLSREMVANDAELNAIVDNSNGSPDKRDKS